jgi:UPF0148 protein
MPVRKEDEIMAECLLKGGKMLEKTCKTCGCPLFEVKGKTFCVVCAENEPAKDGKPAKGTRKAAAPAAPVVVATHAHGEEGHVCSCGEDHDEDSCTCGDEECGDGGLAEELAFTIHSLCERIQNEKDPENVLVLMESVKAGTEALEILCRL